MAVTPDAQQREPSPNLILIGLFGSVALVIVAVIARGLASPERYLLAQALLLAVSAFLFFQILRHLGSNRKGDENSGPSLPIILALVALPYLMKIISDVFRLIGHPVSDLVRAVLLAALALLAILAVVIAAAARHSQSATVSQYVIVPVSLLSLVIYLGGPGHFGFLIDAIPAYLFDGNILVRYIILASLGIAFAADVALSFGRLRRSVSLALARERHRMRELRRAQPLIIRKPSELGRLVQFVIIDLSRIVVLCSTIFATGLYVLWRAAIRSATGIWNGLSAASVGIAILIFLTLLVESYADYVLEVMGRSPWSSDEGWKRLLLCAAYLTWISISTALLFRLTRIRVEDAQYSIVAVLFFLLSGAWFAALVATLAALSFVPSLVGYRTASPFLIMGLGLVLIAVVRTFRKRFVSDLRRETPSTIHL